MTDAQETFAAYDTADYLNSEEAVLAYLNAATEESTTPQQIAHALSVVARARAKNMTALANDARLSREGLYKALSKDGNPSLGTTMRIAKLLGYRIAFAPA